MLWPTVSEREAISAHRQVPLVPWPGPPVHAASPDAPEHAADAAAPDTGADADAEPEAW
jgi:hypothetical protein